MTATLRRAFAAAAVAGLIGLPSTAQASTFNFPAGGGTILGFGSAIATGSDIWVQYLGFEAAYTDDLYFAVSYGDTEHFIFSNKGTTSVGDVFHLNSILGGSFTAGEEVVFAMYVNACSGCTSSWADDDNRVYYTGDPTRNPDGMPHAKFATYNATVGGVLFDMQIGFEDILNGGDEDYDDLVFATSGVNYQVPEPVSLLLMASGLIGVVGVARRRQDDGTLETDEG